MSTQEKRRIFTVRIQRYGIGRVRISRASVLDIFSALEEEGGELIAINYRGENIYPTQRIRSDLRLEIPRRIVRRYGLFKRAPGFLDVEVVYRIAAEIKAVELTMYLNYLPGAAGGKGREREYKILKLVPKADRELLLQYEAEMEEYFFQAFHWLQPYRDTLRYLGLGPYLGITNREYLIPREEWEEEKDYVAVGIFKAGGPLIHAREGKAPNLFWDNLTVHSITLEPGEWRYHSILIVEGQEVRHGNPFYVRPEQVLL